MRVGRVRPSALTVLRLFCLGVVATVGVAGTVAWAPRTMLAGPPMDHVERQAYGSGISEIPAAPIQPRIAEQAAEAVLEHRIKSAATAGPAVLGIPSRVLAAYRRASDTLARTDPTCRLPWWLLAGIGKIESGHARGGRLDATGRTNGEILGPRLDGSLAHTAVIRDSDNGRLDGDTAYDRAVGPMQFLPGTWKGWASDGNGDGRRDPHNIFDASLAAGRYLCAGSGDLSTPAGLSRAILRYNPSGAYLRSVLSWGASYRDGARSVPGETGPVGRGPEPPARGSVPPLPDLPGPVVDIDPEDSSPQPTPTQTQTPTPSPSGPTPKPTDSPSPKPPNSPSPKPTDSPSPKPTNSPSPKPTDSPSPTPSPTPTPTESPSPTPTPTPTCPSPTESPSPSPSPTPTPTPTPTPSPTCPSPAPTDEGPTPSPAPPESGSD